MREIAPTAVKAVRTDFANKAALDIYDLNGKLVGRNGNTEGLPSGVYVVGGRKITLY